MVLDDAAKPTEKVVLPSMATASASIACPRTVTSPVTERSDDAVVQECRERLPRPAEILKRRGHARRPMSQSLDARNWNKPGAARLAALFSSNAHLIADQVCTTPPRPSGRVAVFRARTTGALPTRNRANCCRTTSLVDPPRHPEISARTTTQGSDPGCGTILDPFVNSDTNIQNISRTPVRHSQAIPRVHVWVPQDHTELPVSVVHPSSVRTARQRTAPAHQKHGTWSGLRGTRREKTLKVQITRTPYDS